MKSCEWVFLRDFEVEASVAKEVVVHLVATYTTS